MDNIMLSVICTTYGHEKYLRQALDSILMQKVSFPIEVLIGEDCSPDNSRSILKEYERKYPGFFTMIYRDQNIGATNNYFDLGMKSRGKYLAFLELDDYWTDCNKLQCQVDYLENNTNVYAVAAKTVVVDKNGNKKNENYPECKNDFYSWHHYLSWQLPGQTASIVCRNYFKEKDKLSLALTSDASLFPEDRKWAFIFLNKGKVYCMRNIMSAYRHIGDEGLSYSASIRKYSVLDFYEKYTYFYKGLLTYSYQYSSSKGIICSEIMYVKYNVHKKKHRGDNWIKYLLFDLDVKHKCRVRAFIIYRTIQRAVGLSL